MQFGGSGQTPLREDFTYTARDQVASQTRYSDLAGTSDDRLFDLQLTTAWAG